MYDCMPAQDRLTRNQSTLAVASWRRISWSWSMAPSLSCLDKPDTVFCPAGDLLTRYMPSSGRIVAAQFSVLMTFPCTLIIYKLLPITAPGGMDTLMTPYACVFFVTGCLISW